MPLLFAKPEDMFFRVEVHINVQNILRERSGSVVELKTEGLLVRASLASLR